jgi:hypothetical protein
VSQQDQDAQGSRQEIENLRSHMKNQSDQIIENKYNLQKTMGELDRLASRVESQEDTEESGVFRTKDF